MQKVMVDILKDSIGMGPRSKDPTSTLRKFMGHVAPYVLPAMCLLGVVLVSPGIVKMACDAIAPGTWNLAFWGTSSCISGLLCFPLGVIFGEWQNLWWFNRGLAEV
jgi:hypothetical protein